MFIATGSNEKSKLKGPN